VPIAKSSTMRRIVRPPRLSRNPPTLWIGLDPVDFRTG
jgi:hypothetical protein